MKRALLAVCFAALAVPVFGQSTQMYRWDETTRSWTYFEGTMSVPATSYYQVAQPQMVYSVVYKQPVVLPNHEIAFHTSMTEGTSSMYKPLISNLSRSISPDPAANSISPWEVINNGKIYKVSEGISDPISLSYFYRPVDHLQIGILATFQYHETAYNDVLTRQRYGKLTDYIFGFTPTIRLYYVETKWIRGYVGLGYSIFTASYNRNFNDRRTKTAYDWDFTPIGFSVGNKFFVAFECGYLASGYAKLIIGARF